MGGSWCDKIGMPCGELGERDEKIGALEKDVITWRDEATAQGAALCGLMYALGCSATEVNSVTAEQREAHALAKIEALKEELASYQVVGAAAGRVIATLTRGGGANELVTCEQRYRDRNRLEINRRKREEYARNRERVIAAPTRGGGVNELVTCEKCGTTHSITQPHTPTECKIARQANKS